MAEESRCPNCGKQLPVDAPVGICPQCLFCVAFDVSQAEDVNPDDDPTVSCVMGSLSDATTLDPIDRQNVDSVNLPAKSSKVRYFGHYELLQEIDRGGMGIVYKARQVNLNREVALKMILTGQQAGQNEIKRFYTEAEAAAQLDHPGIVPIFEVGEHEGQHFFTMRFVEGQSLAARVARGPLPPREAAQLVHDVALAVQYAHEHGVIHRDLKPGNILLNLHGKPQITDFGLAKLTKNGSDLTGSGQILGTPSYMPPEQAGSKVGEIGPHSDVYSLGAILYCLLTGRPPFHAATPVDTLMQVLNHDPAPLRQLNLHVPRDLETIALKCLEKEPDQRYVSANALAEDLQRWMRGVPIKARRNTVWEWGAKWARRNPTSVISIAAGLLLLVVGSYAGFVIREGVIENHNETRAIGLVKSVVSADIDQVMPTIPELSEFRKWADPRLRHEFEVAAENSRQKLNASLALLPVDDTQVAYLKGRLLDASSAEIGVIRDAVEPHKQSLLAELWKVAETPEKDRQSQRLRAAAALAKYDSTNRRWTQIQEDVGNDLVAVPAVHVSSWMDVLLPVSEKLIRPLQDVYRDTRRRETERSLATDILTVYAADQPDVLVDLLANAEPFQFQKIYDMLIQHRDRCLALGKAELEKQLNEDASEDEKEALGHRKANVAIALLKLGEAEQIWGLLKHSPDPRARSNFIHWLSPLNGDPQVLIRRLLENDKKDDKTIRIALLLTLGEFSESQLPGVERARLFETIKDIYKFDPDAGLHAAAEWLLIQWKEDQSIQIMKDQLSVNEQQLRSQMLKDERQWYINKQGQTFVILNADEFQMGSPLSESDRVSNETPHRQRIGRKLAIASKELTKGEYRRFLEANSNAVRIDIEQFSKTNDSPQVDLSWYDAARYCNWLSQTEGLPENQWCYERNAASEYAEGMRAAPDFLERTGYRLPTEAEWEFACRAGAVTSRYYGESDDLLFKYAWFARNSPKQFAQPTGLLKPNDFGLFDTLGNVSEWCHDAFGEYHVNSSGEATADVRDTKAVQKDIHRVLRGGSYILPESSIRSAYRFNYQPEMVDTDFGFRPVRTCPSPR